MRLSSSLSPGGGTKGQDEFCFVLLLTAVGFIYEPNSIIYNFFATPNHMNIPIIDNSSNLSSPTGGQGAL